MKLRHTQRGFEIIEFEKYPNEQLSRLVHQASIIGDYEDAWDKPGSSCLWIGEYHLLSREQIAELIQHLQAWLNTGSLSIEECKENEKTNL